MHRFYHPQFETPPAAVTLSPEESHHMVHVLRLKADDTVELTDGAGNIATAVVVRLSAKGSGLQVTALRQEPKTTSVSLVFALPKGPALDFIIRRCTELGVARLQPLITAHSSAKSSWNEARWARVVAEVAKQCQASWFPEIAPARDLSDWLAQRDNSSRLIFCDENHRRSQVASVLSSLPPGSPCEVVVGAEGGWRREEIENLSASGGIPLGLGANRLRAETATLVSLTLVKAHLAEL